MAYIYGLQLENGKYYVGRTDNVENRYQQHARGEGAVWTKTYKPIRIILMKLSTSSMDEDKYTKEFMAEYGIDNVRGGSYVTFDLNQQTKDFLQKEIWGSLNFCTRCGQPGHFINNCKVVIPSSNNIPYIPPKPITNIPYIPPQNNTNIPYIPQNNTNTDKPVKIKTCKRCNRTGHGTKDCHAKTKLGGKEIQIKKCSRCKRAGHNKTKCVARTDVNGIQL